MTLREAISVIYNYRIGPGDMGWEDAYRTLERTGTWSSPRKLQLVLLEVIKRLSAQEEHDKRPDTGDDSGL